MRETKLNILLGNYKLFKMKSDETVTKMFTWFTVITNGLANRGKIFTNAKKMNKILRSHY